MLELSRDEAGGGNGKRGGKLNGVQRNRQFQQTPKMFDGTGAGKYVMLRRRQVKIETEAWEQAAKEYMELLMDMCEQKLAPKLPYVKSLFLGWFEPLRDKTAAEQEYCRDVGNRSSHGPFFDLLPAEMMAVITMHKLMSVLVTSSGDGGVLVVQAACKIGEAIEQEASSQFRDFQFALGTWFIQQDLCSSNNYNWLRLLWSLMVFLPSFLFLDIKLL